MPEDQRLRVENQRLKDDLERLREEKAALKHPIPVLKGSYNIPLIHIPTNARYRFLVAIGIVFVAAVIRFDYLQALGTRSTFVTFYPAVILAALYGGFWPGLLAMVLSAVLIDYYGIEPMGTFSSGGPTHWLSMGAFLFGCTLISCITEVMRREHSRAVSAAEQLAIHAEELERVSDTLAESEERLRLAIDAAHMGSWDWNLLTGEIYWTPFHDALFGFEQGKPQRIYKDFQ